jgi:hypothetical protein
VDKTIFHQLVTIHGIEKNVSIPLLYCLLSAKSEAIYKALFNNLRKLVTKLPTRLTTDFEFGLLACLRKYYPSIDIVGCYMHFRSAILKKAKQQFAVEYRDNTDNFAWNLKRLTSLSFVPPEKVYDSFKLLREDFQDNYLTNYSDFLDYFVKTWLQNTSSANILISMWNHYKSLKSSKSVQLLIMH